jgi:hypothetical protein
MSSEQIQLNFDFEDLEYDQARSAKEHLETMMESPGWAMFVQFMEERAQLRERELYDMIPSSTEEMVKFAIFKGGIQELRFVSVMMEQVLSDLREQIKRAQDEAAEAAEEEGLTDG